MGIPADQWQEWLDCRDGVPNLQFMEGGRNESKQATPIKTWLEKEYKEARDRERFAGDNYFPQDVGLEFENFRAFFEKRREKLRDELIKVLAITTAETPETAIDWGDRDDELETPETPIVEETTA